MVLWSAPWIFLEVFGRPDCTALHRIYSVLMASSTSVADPYHMEVAWQSEQGLKQQDI